MRAGAAACVWGIAAASLPVVVTADSFPAVLPLADLYLGDGSEGFVLRAHPPRPRFFAYHASVVGDINGDGLADVAVGGRRDFTYVVFGRTSGFPAVFSLDDLLPDNGGDGSAGFVLEQESDHIPEVGAAGDVNGDGLDDLIIGFGYYGPHGPGRSYVLFGRDTANRGNYSPLLDLESLAPPAGDGSLGFVIEGAHDCDAAGTSVGAAGDVNGDGIGDLVIGAPGKNDVFCYYSPVLGRSYVVFGRDTPQQGNFPAAFELANLQPEDGGDGSAGFILEAAERNDRPGWAVSSAGDVNGDGIADVLVSAWLSPPLLYSGQAYVVFGRDTADAGNFPAEMSLGSLLPAQGGDGSVGFAITGASPYSHAGYSLSSAGDMNSDGIDDILVGSPGTSDNAYVIFGRDAAHQGNFPANFPLKNLSPDNGGTGRAGFVITSGDNHNEIGTSVSGAGDLNGDGVADLIVGAPNASRGQTLAGEAFVVFGRNDAHAGRFPPVFPTRLLLPPIGDGHAGFVIAGVPAALAGTTVSGGGDINGDGVDDVVVSTIDGASIVFGRAPGR